MLHATLNLGILAHVDAGKTTLTERLLFDAGVIPALGSVDRGTTQTDTLDLERARGITIRAAVVSFALDGLCVNLIDTPGHPDFIAEVERSLAVLDGAVLVVSAVEGVQAQTLVLMHALERLRIPTLVFVNKTDRRGADVERVFGQIRDRLTPNALRAGSIGVEQLAERDDAVLAAYLDGRQVDVAAELASQVQRLRVCPVYAGSAITGDGVDALRSGIRHVLPRAAVDDGPLAASVFKIERGASGEKIAYVRVFAGSLAVRDRVGEEKVTALEVYGDGGSAARAGDIAKVWGLRSLRIGDRLGAPERATPPPQFPRPTLEAVVEPRNPEARHELSVALDRLAEQDPLIAVRRRDEELAVSLYGEVQKEVLEETLAHDFGVAVSFRETTPIYVERPVGVGDAREVLNAPTNPTNAQLGLRVAPGVGATVQVAVEDHSRIPLYVYKRREEFDAAMDAYVRDALAEGLHGWNVVDVAVTVIDSWYSLADGPPSRRGPMPTAGDFRALTPLVLRAALADAGVVVCEPMLAIHVAVPTDALGATLAAAAHLGATVDAPAVEGSAATFDGEIPAIRLADLQRRLPALTRGEGFLESSFAGYRPVEGDPPSARR